MNMNVTYLREVHDWFLYEVPDPRTKGWFLVDCPYTIVTILLSYLAFVLYIGPKWMRDREPFAVKKYVIALNLVHVILCAYIFSEGISVWSTYNWTCQNVVYRDDELTRRGMVACYLFFVAKSLEMVDTLLYVLRKSFRQITFLHVYHHFLMVLTAYGGVKYLPGGHGTFMGIINTFIHVFMYTHYLIAAVWPRYPGHLHVKKTVTIMQLIQFALIAFHTCFLFWIDCGYPGFYPLLELPQDFAMFGLFLNFYYQTYVKPTKVQTVDKRSSEKKTK